jgi:hypothetical protein
LWYRFGVSSLKLVLTISNQPVLIVVGHCDSHAGLFLAVVVERRAGWGANLLEFAVPQVVKEQARLRVAGDVQVWIAVVVEIRSRDRKAVASRRLAEPARRRNILEVAASPVVERTRSEGRLRQVC